MSEYFIGKIAMITGSSAGIGRELALQLASHGADLVLVARRTERLEELREEIERRFDRKSLICGADIRDPAALKQVMKSIEERFGRLDIMIANAGFGVVGAFEKLTIADYQRQFDTNVWGLMETLWAALPLLKKSSGQIVLMGSVAGHIGTAGSSAYSMSKFAVRALAQSLVYEVKKYGIAVTLLSPGFIESEIRDVNNLGEQARRPKEGIPPGQLIVKTPVAVSEMIRAIASRKREIVITRHGKILAFFSRFCPGLVLFLAARTRNY